MTNTNLMMGNVTLDLASFTNKGKQEFLNQILSAVDAKLTITTASGEIVELSVGEILEADVTAYDAETNIEIVEDNTWLEI